MRLGLTTGQLGDRGRDGERELRARAEADVGRDRLEHTDPRAPREAERLPAARGHGERPLGIGTLGADVVARGRLHHRGGPAEGHPEPTEPARAVAGDIEHAHVQARRRLDAHRRHPPLTCRRTSSIASRSRGPAVLSTSTWRRRSSAPISAAGSRLAREAMIDASSTA